MHILICVDLFSEYLYEGTCIFFNPLLMNSLGKPRCIF